MKNFESRPFVPPEASVVSNILLVAIVVAALYFLREVLVPITLAVLLSFVLAPLVRLLRNWYVPRSVAVVFSVIVAFGIIVGLGSLIVSQVTQLASDLPRYQVTLREKIQSLRGATAGKETLERASQVLQELGKELDKPKSGAPVISEPPQTNKPIPVEIKEPDPGALQSLLGLIRPLIDPLTTTGIVIIFVIFILLQREDLRNRMIRLAGAQDLQRTTAALDDAGKRLSRLFLTQLALNAGFGIVIGVGLWLIGVPSAPLWGMLAMVLRFVPYIGAIISAILPLVLAAAVGPDWQMVALTAALFAIVEPVTGHVIEPMLYGRSTGLSPVAVVTSAAFWTWLWGPIGLVLATPLTMCLVVLGKYVDRLKFLDVVLGDEPALKPAEITYQRMLAGDPVETAEQARQILKERALLDYYQDVLIEALKLAQADADRGFLDEGRKQRIRDVIAEILDDLEVHQDTNILAPEDSSEDASQSADGKTELLKDDAMGVPESWRQEQKVLCLPGRDLLGEAFALIVAQLVNRQGIAARSESSEALTVSRLFRLDISKVALICLCFVGNATKAQISYGVRRLRKKSPNAFILVALVGETVHSIDDFVSEDIGSIQYTLSGTLDEISRVARSTERAEVHTLIKARRVDRMPLLMPGI